MIRVRPLAIALCASALALTLSACGLTGGFGNEGKETGTLDSINGPYLNFNNDLRYQVQISRYLNPYDIEDRAYLKGLPPGTPPLAPSEQWFAIFVAVANETNQSHLSANDFHMIDTTGQIYRPIQLNPAINDFAYFQQNVDPKGIVPTPSSIASDAPIGGVELIFRVPRTFFFNRPVALEIVTPSQQTKSVTLDI